MSEVFNCDKDQRLTVPGYRNLITRCRDYNNGGEVGMFVNNTFDFKIRNNLSVFITHRFESLFIEIISKTKFNKDTILGVIYRFNVALRADFDNFSSTLHDLMDVFYNK